MVEREYNAQTREQEEHQEFVNLDESELEARAHIDCTLLCHGCVIWSELPARVIHFCLSFASRIWTSAASLHGYNPFNLFSLSVQLMLIPLTLNGKTEPALSTGHSTPTATTTPPPLLTGEDRPKLGGCLPLVTSSAPPAPPTLSAPTQTQVRNKPTASAETDLLPSPTTKTAPPNNLP